MHKKIIEGGKGRGMSKRCGKCGTTLEQFYKTSLLGCEHCYRAFREELLPVLRKLHGVTEHVGKTPKVGGIERQLLCEYETLLKEKESAMLRGEFDEANELGEEIRQLYYELARRGLK